MEGELRFKSPFRINQQLVNNELCIICQSSDTEDLKSTENGRQRVIEAASKKLDIVWERLRSYGDQPFNYHLNNRSHSRNFRWESYIGKLKLSSSFLIYVFFIQKISAIEFSFSVCRFVTN